MKTLPISRTGAHPATILIKLDDDIYDRLVREGWRLHLTEKGYVILSMSLHHFIAGRPAEGMVIDHANRDRGDNRRENLRHFTLSENAQNNGGKMANTSGLRGVIPMRSGWYGARGCVGKVVRKVRGTFASPREAHAAYLRVVLQAGSMLPDSAPDIDLSVLDEFPDTIPSRKKTDQLPTGVTRCGKTKYRASIRRDKTITHLGGAFPTVVAAATAFAEAEAAYLAGGLDAVREVAKRYKLR